VTVSRRYARQQPLPISWQTVDLGTRPACNSLVEPDLLDDGCVLDQAHQRGLGGHQRPARVLLRQPVHSAIELTVVVAENTSN
jgi:hypothetical protein